MLDWNISYIGVAIAALFAAMGGVVLGVMFGLSTRRDRDRMYATWPPCMRPMAAPGKSGPGPILPPGCATRSTSR